MENKVSFIWVSIYKMLHSKPTNDTEHNELCVHVDAI